jgi:ParB family chromosome partitioning protein
VTAKVRHICPTGDIRVGKREVARFDPTQTAVKLDALNSAKKVAKRIKDWDALREAIDAIVKEQKDFVAWWNGHVTPGQGPGRGLRKTVANGQLFSAAEKTGVKKPQVSKWKARLENEDNYRAALFESVYSPMWSAAAGPARYACLLGDYEWYTPKEIVDAARQVMGGIDLDPASCGFANRIVKAKEFYTETEDGLSKQWAADRLFLNPPFKDPIVRFFAEKLLESFRAGSVKQAVWLSNNSTDVRWWHQLARHGVVCFHLGRIKFYRQEETPGQSPFGQSIIYLGKSGYPRRLCHQESNAGTRGKVTLISVNSPGSVSTSIEPPCCFTMMS